MDFLAIRKKAKERAEAQARAQAAARPPPPPEAPAPEVPPPPPPARDPAPPAPAQALPATPAAAGPLLAAPAGPLPGAAPIEAALREELTRLAARGARLPLVAPEEAPAPPRPEGRGPPADPLEEFFWSEDEVAPRLPDMGAGTPAPAGPEAPDEERREYISFLLGGEEYAVGVERVREILKSPPITEVPRAPAHVVGVITVRGDVVAVIDPRRRLALPPQPPGVVPRIVVCETAEGPAGLLVDAVAQVVRLLPSAIEPRPAALAGPASEAIAGIGRDRDRLFILLDLDVLLRSGAGLAEAQA